MLDVSGLSSITDYYVIATGNSAPHLKALSEGLQSALKKEGINSNGTSGTAESQWLVLDYLDVVVHLFSEEARAYYAIEELWSDANRVAQ